MRTAHVKERHTKPKQGKLNKRPSRYQQWRAAAWCVSLRGRKRRRYHQRNTFAYQQWGGGFVHIHELSYSAQVWFGQS